MNEPPAVTDQIVTLLRAEGPLTMSKIASKLGRNPGGIRPRLLRMARSGRVVESVGAEGWTVYSAPGSSGQEDREPAK